MQPQQPYQQPTQQPPQPTQNPAGGDHQGNFDFIMNPGSAPKKSLFNFGGKLGGRLLIIVGGLFVAVIILALVVNLTKNNGFDKASMLAVAHDQAEILALVKFGEDNTKSQTLENFNATSTLSTTSDQAALLTYMGSNGVKSKDLVTTVDPEATTQLNAAISAGTFDTTYKSVLDTKLKEYQADLASAYKTAGPKGQAVLKAQYNNAKLLRTQLND